MSGRVSASNLAPAIQDIQVEWDNTRGSWRDQKSREFGEKYLAVLPDILTKANALMSEVDVLIRKVRQDCE